MAADFLIVGQGLAGNLLAYELTRRGATVLIVDPGDLQSTSRVAPGIVNPLAGRKLLPVWRVDEILPFALEKYAELESLLARRFFRHCPIIRVMNSEAQAELLKERAMQPASARYIGDILDPGQLGPAVNDRYGSFVARGTGWLDTIQIIASLRLYWQDLGVLSPTLLDPETVHPDGNSIRWNGKAFGCCIFCEGWQAMDNPWFSWIPWKPARGEMLDLHTSSAPFLREDLGDCILNSGHWLLPLGNGHYRAGASYSWNNFEAPPSPEARDEILQSISDMVNVSFSVIGQQVGVRPAIKDRFPVLGHHPEFPQIALLNGFGSKGVLIAPWLAQLFADHLLEEKSLPDEVNVRRFFRQ